MDGYIPEHGVALRNDAFQVHGQIRRHGSGQYNLLLVDCMWSYRRCGCISEHVKFIPPGREAVSIFLLAMGVGMPSNRLLVCVRVLF